MPVSFLWLDIAMQNDHGLQGKIKPGDLVQHCNGGQWGVVLQVVPRGNTDELQIRGICRPDVQWDDPGVRWWGTYHLRNWAPVYGPVRE